MKTTDSSTQTALAVPAVMAIGCSPELVARCTQALEGIGVALRTCDFLNAATAVAERRPLALVMPDDLYAFDPDEFDALARDVQASLVRIEDDIPVAKLELLLGTAIDAAAAKRGELLPAWPDAEAPPVLERDDRETRRTTEPNQALISYAVTMGPQAAPYPGPAEPARIGQRLPSRPDLATVTWNDVPPSRPGT